MNTKRIMDNARAALADTRTPAQVAVDATAEKLGAAVGKAPQHTPGKWMACSHRGGQCYRIETKGTGNDLEPIADLHGPDCRANARLIAAAPDLLAACRILCQLVDVQDHDVHAVKIKVADLVPVVRHARAAIARAEGGAA